MKNSHPDKAIKYSLIRYFSKVPQAGRARGVIEPGGEPVKLGCTLVDQREQTWEIQSATYANQ